MSNIATAPSFVRRHDFPLAPALWSAPSRLPWWSGFETVMAETLDVIHTGARLAWWDGSAIGLRLHAFAGLIETDETGTGREP